MVLFGKPHTPVQTPRSTSPLEDKEAYGSHDPDKDTVIAARWHQSGRTELGTVCPDISQCHDDSEGEPDCILPSLIRRLSSTSHRADAGVDSTQQVMLHHPHVSIRVR